MQPDEATVERLLHEHDLTDLGGGVVKHSHWEGDREHGHDFAASEWPVPARPIKTHLAQGSGLMGDRRNVSERMAIYGACEFCGAARDERTTDDGEMTRHELWCPSCGREAT